MNASFQLFDELSAEEFETLKASIADKGLLVPITRDQNGVVIDGNHRERACRELGIDPRYEVHVFADDTERRVRALVMNLLRRHLTREQKAKAVAELRTLGYTFERIEAETGIPESTAQRLVTESDVNSQMGNEIANSKGMVTSRGVRPSSYKRRTKSTVVQAKNRREADRAGKALTDLGDQAPAKVMDTKQAERAARDKATEQARAEADVTPVDLGDVRIEHCSLADLSLEPDSVDLIFTDPPYPAEFLPLWSDLGQLAAKALKPGGLLVAYSGQMFLPEAMTRLAAHLDYWWMFAITHVGAFFQLRARHTQVGWKPLLVYRKPGGADLPPWVNDIVTDGVREKSGHNWQQSEAEAAYWIEKLTDAGGLVVDPFLGSGTTAAVAKRLGRRVVGCDVDPLAVQRSKERIACP